MLSLELMIRIFGYAGKSLYYAALAARLISVGKIGESAVSGTVAGISAGGSSGAGQAFSAAQKKTYALFLARELVAHIKKYVAENRGDNPNKSPFTRMMQNMPPGKKGAPLINTGDFINYLIIERKRSGYMVRFDDSTPITRDGLTPQDLLSLHENGFELLKDDYPEIRRYIVGQMIAYGVTPKKPSNPSRYYRLPARPFFNQAVREFQTEWNGKQGVNITRHGKRVSITVR